MPMLDVELVESFLIGSTILEAARTLSAKYALFWRYWVEFAYSVELD